MLLRRLRHRLRAGARARAVARLQAEPVGAPPPALDLALVIPVHNDAAGLARLLEQAREFDCFSQIVVVDDGSELPVAVDPGVRLLRHERPLGGGVARNAGLAQVTAQHVLFFDADDLLLPELLPLLADLAQHRQPDGPAFDFCMFRHADSRVTAEGRRGQPDWDDLLWQEAGHGCGALREAEAAMLPLLARTANYPWNKIYRTAFLRQHGIGCAATRVHQDIPLHWLGFIAAGRVLVSDRICAWHRVSAGGGRLTNRAGPERLEVFAALDPVVAMAGPAWRASLARFILGLTDWGAGRIDPGLLAEFRATEAAWLGQRLGAWDAEIAAQDPELAARLRARVAGVAQPRAAVGPVAAVAGATMGFLVIARDAGIALWDLSGDIAAVAQPGDQVVLVDDGPEAAARAWSGRFAAMRDWPAGVTVEVIATATRGQGDSGIALNIGLDAMRSDRVILLPGTARLEPGAFRAARAAAGAAAADLLRCPITIADPDDPAPPGSPDPLVFAGLILSRQLFQATGLRCAEGREAGGDLALLLHPMALLPGPPVLHLRQRPATDPALFAVLADLLRREPGRAGPIRDALPGWLAGQGQGLVGAWLAALPDLGPVADVVGRDPGTVRRACAVAPLAAPLPGGAPVRVALLGPHTRRTPFAYPHLAGLWEHEIALVTDPATADLAICAHPQDLPGLPPGLAEMAARRAFALVSEEPFWDSLFSPAPLAARVLLPAGRAGALHLHQVNHHRSAIFGFERIPYFLLTEPGYVAAYARLFARNAARSAADWQADNLARPTRLIFMAERRPESFHDLAIPQGDILGLCAWRTRLALACGDEGVERLGASWQGGTPRVALQDWHGDKLARLDGRGQVLSALENTHQPAYISEKLFDAFACGARPLYLASAGHRVHDLGLPAASWVNLWGLQEPAAAARVRALQPADQDWTSYAAAQSRLASLFGDAATLGAERLRLRRAVLAEVARLTDLGPA